jgi:peroxiredoxin
MLFACNALASGPQACLGAEKGVNKVKVGSSKRMLILLSGFCKIHPMKTILRNKTSRTFLLILFWLFFLLSASAQAQVGEKAPGFITSTLEGKRVSLKEYWEQQGKKAIVLSFFATWCQPCKEDLKYLQGLQEQLGSQGFQVLSVLTQDSSAKADAVKKFLQDLGVNLPVLLDEHGIIGKRYGVTALPCNVLIDKEGTLQAKYLGYNEAVKKDFEGKFRPLLASP